MSISLFKFSRSKRATEMIAKYFSSSYPPLVYLPLPFSYFLESLNILLNKQKQNIQDSLRNVGATETNEMRLVNFRYIKQKVGIYGFIHWNAFEVWRMLIGNLNIDSVFLYPSFENIYLALFTRFHIFLPCLFSQKFYETVLEMRKC